MKKVIATLSIMCFLFMTGMTKDFFGCTWTTAAIVGAVVTMANLLIFIITDEHTKNV